MSLDPLTTYQRWRATHPVIHIDSIPDGFRRCQTPGCPVMIEERQERAYCYGCGGKRNTGRAVNYGTEVEWRKHVERMRSLGARSGKAARIPY